MLLIREVSTKNRKISLIFNQQAMKEINKKNLSVWPGEKERETERESNLCFVCLGRISLGNYRLGLFGGGQSIWQNDTCAEDKSPSDQLSFLHVSWFKILVLTDCSRFDARHQKDLELGCLYKQSIRILGTPDELYCELLKAEKHVIARKQNSILYQ